MTAWSTALEERAVIGVIRHLDDDVAERIARAAVDGGIGVIEITFTVPAAARLITRLREDLPGVVIGAGTVLTGGALSAAVDAGAAFVVSPVVDADLMRAAATLGIPFVPGAATPTEAATASRHGASVVKIFPAAVLGTSFISSLRDVLPDVALIPTGGIRAADVDDWFAAGASAVGLAGALTAAWTTGGADAVRATARTATSAASLLRSTP